jgi:hypothetical protein
MGPFRPGGGTGGLSAPFELPHKVPFEIRQNVTLEFPHIDANPFHPDNVRIGSPSRIQQVWKYVKDHPFIAVAAVATTALILRKYIPLKAATEVVSNPIEQSALRLKVSEMVDQAVAGGVKVGDEGLAATGVKVGERANFVSPPGQAGWLDPASQVKPLGEIHLPDKDVFAGVEDLTAKVPGREFVSGDSVKFDQLEKLYGRITKLMTDYSQGTISREQLDESVRILLPVHE